MKRFSPLGKRLLVEPIESENLSPGGIVIPDAVKAKPNRGRVLSVGPYVAHVVETNIVLFSKYAGDELELDGQKRLIIDEDDVLGIVDE